jgi:cytochrome bd-type quinol oxidase subunit 1
MKMKNVLLVIVVILTPIIILGAMAMSGAEEFHKKKVAAEEGHTTEAIMPMVTAEQVQTYEANGFALPTAMGALA